MAGVTPPRGTCLFTTKSPVCTIAEILAIPSGSRAWNFLKIGGGCLIEGSRVGGAWRLSDVPSAYFLKSTEVLRYCNDR